MKRLISFTILIFIAFFSYGQTAKIYFENGLKKYNLEDYQGAIVDFTKAIQLNPKHIDAIKKRGNAYFELDNYQRAISDFNKVLLNNSTDTNIFFIRGRAKFELKNYTSAINDFTKVVQLNPKDAEAYYYRGMAIYNNIKHPILTEISDSINNIALADFNKSIEINPKDGLLYYKVGITTMTMDKYTDAIFYFTKAIEINPNNYEAYLKRGLIKEMLERQNKPSDNVINYLVGVEDYSKAIEISPNYIEAYMNRALAKEMAKDYSGALADYDRILEIAPNDPRGLYESIRIRHISLDDHNATLSDYNKLIKIDGKYWNYSKRGAIKEELGDYKGAIEDYSIAIRLNNKDKDLFFNRASAKYVLNDFRGAIADYTAAILLDNKYAQAYFMRANAKFNIKDYNGAIKDYDKVAEIGNYISENETINIMGVKTKGLTTRRVFSENCLLYINRGKAKLSLNNKNGACLDWSKASEFECGEEDVYALIKEYCN